MKKENKIIDFSPFVNISVADNMVWRYIDYSNSQSTEEGEAAIEWHIENEGDDVFEIDYCEDCGPSTKDSQIVYRGKIPTRKFFVELLKNLENFPKI